MGRPRKLEAAAPPEEEVAPAIDEAATASTGAGRVLLYQTWAGNDDTNRRLGGVLLTIYSGPLLVRGDLRKHVNQRYGSGYYTIVVQQKFEQEWRFISAENFVIEGKVTAEFLEVNDGEMENEK